MYTFMCPCIWAYIHIYGNVTNPKVDRKSVGTGVVLEATV